MDIKKIKFKPLLVIIVVLLLGVVGITFSYFYTEVIFPNQFKMMTYNVKVEEEFNDTWGTKKVSFINKDKLIHQ